MNSSKIEYIQSVSCSSGKIAVRSILPDGKIKNVVLLLHGATLPSIIFDLPGSENQQSFMSYLASKSCAVYSIDFPGYGLSSKPIEMNDASMTGHPLISHKEAAQEVCNLKNFIEKQHPKIPIVLCGFSWGSSISGYIATNYNWVSKLILLGPVYSYKNPQWRELANTNDQTKLNPGIKSYRIASKEKWCGLWDRELRQHNAFEWRSHETLENLINHVEDTDIEWAKSTNNLGFIRIPTGVLLDALRVYNENPIYDASKIECPTLVLRGKQDSASLNLDVKGLMSALTCNKQRIDIDNASHYGILERGALRFFSAVADFISY